MKKPWSSMKNPWSSSGSKMECFMEILWKLHGELFLESLPPRPLHRSNAETNTTFRSGKRTEFPSTLHQHVAILHGSSMGSSTICVPLMDPVECTFRTVTQLWANPRMLCTSLVLCWVSRGLDPQWVIFLHKATNFFLFENQL